ncbi:hypothetical protein E6C27_scaffold288G001440 [Cucumis melo var. makuwa]|uniref:Uncharacterized protein n=1 Tax=Cucumis melo var. makuwa TaxID=1194695 RepID=A0A5A7UN47_CUCMM|nr:hypothetical protein E6C27_scaffold288G001440 [Cucumis melo var. makuwa]
MDAFTIIGQLKAMFQEQARQERVNTIKAFVNYKLAKGSPVSPYVLKMKSYFVMSYNMHEIEKSLTQLHGMLKTAKLNIKFSSEVLMVQKGKNPKKRERDQGKGKEKVVVKASKVDALAVPRSRPKPKEPKPPKEGECYFCKKIEHWNRKCPIYLEELKKNKGSIPSTSDFEKWLQTMKFGMRSMYGNQVSSLIDASEGIKIIGYKWVFKKKTDMDGNVHTYKAGLVVKDGSEEAQKDCQHRSHWWKEYNEKSYDFPPPSPRFSLSTILPLHDSSNFPTITNTIFMILQS